MGLDLVWMISTILGRSASANAGLGALYIPISRRSNSMGHTQCVGLGFPKHRGEEQSGVNLNYLNFYPTHWGVG